jgi:hypothetical protein
LFFETERKKVECHHRGTEETEELTNEPENHFFFSLQPRLEIFSPLDNLVICGKIQDDMIQAYKREESQMHQELEISQLPVSVIQMGNSYTCYVTQY